MARFNYRMFVPIFAALVVAVPSFAQIIDPIGDDGLINAADILEVIRDRRSAALSPEATPDPDSNPNSDDVVDHKDFFIFAAQFEDDAPTALPPTATPTPEPNTPTPTPTEGGPATFDMADYFRLDPDSRWRFIGFEGGSAEDNFEWTTQGTKDSGDIPTLSATVNIIQTDTDEATDDRNGDQDFWFFDGDGMLFYHGYHNGNADVFDAGFFDVTIPVQDIVVNPPLPVGGADQAIPSTVTGSGSAVVQTSPLGEQTVPVDIQVAFDGFVPVVNTPMGQFTNCLHMTVSISASFLGQSYTFVGSEFWLKEGVGLVKHDQEPDPDDAEIQAISEGSVNGVPITAN